MDPLYSKAQRQVGGKSKTSATSSKTSSKRSKKKKRAPKMQTAGQPSGTPLASASVASGRSRAQRQVDRGSEPSGDGDSGVGKWSLRAMGTLHVVDALLGLACISYGAIIHVTEVTATSVCYGLVLTIGALCGGIGYWAKTGKMRGLQASAMAGLFAAFLDVAGFVFTLVSWDSFITFVKDNAGDLLLNDSSIVIIDSLKIFFAIIFIVLACFEVFR